MALQTSGAISLNQIHVEAGGTSGTQCSISDEDMRAMIGKTSGSIAFSEYYGASSYVAPTEDDYYEMTLIGTISGQTSSWGNHSYSMSPYAGQKGRMVFLYNNGLSGTFYQGDLQLDNINFNGTIFGFEATGHDWITSADGVSNAGSFATNNYGAFQENIDNYVAVGGYALGRWCIRTGGTPSGNTGLASASVGSYYVYAETSAGGNGFGFTLASPLTQLGSSPPNITFDSARYGANIGTLRVYWAYNKTVDPYPPAAPTIIYGSLNNTYGSPTGANIVDGNMGSSWRGVFTQWPGFTDGTICRLVVAYISGSSWAGDVQLDDFWANCTAYQAGGSTQGQTNLYIDSSVEQSDIVTSYSAGYTFPVQADIQTIYNNSNWTQLGYSPANGSWGKDAYGTPSSGTGVYGLPSGYYTYYEASGGGNPRKMRLLRSRQFAATANNGFRGRVAGYGSAVGRMRFFIALEP